MGLVKGALKNPYAVSVVALVIVVLGRLGHGPWLFGARRLPVALRLGLWGRHSGPAREQLHRIFRGRQARSSGQSQGDHLGGRRRVWRPGAVLKPLQQEPPHPRRLRL